MMRLVDFIIGVYQNEELILHLQLTCLIDLLLAGVLIHYYWGPPLPLFVHGTAVYLLGFSYLVGNDALVAFADIPRVDWGFKLPIDHCCDNYHWSATYMDGDCSYTNNDCRPVCYLQPLAQTLLASGEIEVDNKTFEFTPWKLRPIEIIGSYQYSKGYDDYYSYITLYRSVKR